MPSTGPETSLAANELDKGVVSAIRGTLKPRLGFLRSVDAVPSVLGSLASQPQLQQGRPLGATAQQEGYTSSVTFCGEQ